VTSGPIIFVYTLNSDWRSDPIIIMLIFCVVTVRSKFAENNIAPHFTVKHFSHTPQEHHSRTYEVQWVDRHPAQWQWLLA